MNSNNIKNNLITIKNWTDRYNINQNVKQTGEWHGD